MFGTSCSILSGRCSRCCFGRCWLPGAHLKITTTTGEAMKIRMLLMLTAITVIGCEHRAAETKSPVDSPESRVSIDNFSYSPAELTIRPGTRVTWTNHDDVPHTVTESAKAFTSGTLDTDQTFS